MLFICLFTYLFFQSKLFVKHLIEGKEMEGRVVLRYSWTLRDVSSFLAKKCRLHGLFLPMNESSLRPSFDIIAQITSIAQGISKCAKVIKKITKRYRRDDPDYKGDRNCLWEIQVCIYACFHIIVRIAIIALVVSTYCSFLISRTGAKQNEQCPHVKAKANQQ